MKNKHKYYFGVLFFLIAQLLFLQVAVGASDSNSKSAVEKRQKLEIERFFLGGKNEQSVPQIPMAIELYNQAVEFFEKNEYEMAVEALNSSIALDSRISLAYELLAEIYYLKQDFDKALESYKKAFSLDPSARLREKIEKVQGEANVEEGLDTYHEEHFIIKYKGGSEGYDGYYLKNLLRETYRIISKDFGHYFRHKTVVLFYDAKEFYEVTGKPHWVGGLYDGKIRLPAHQNNLSALELRALVMHEMTHAFVSSVGGMQVPAWIHEGLAQYEENKVRPIDLFIFKAAVKTNSLIPIETLVYEKLSLEGADPLNVMLFYQESFKFVSYMVERYKMYRVKNILGHIKDGEDSVSAIESVLKISLKRLDKEWRSTL